MKIELGYIGEPFLQFGRDRHPDIRYGIMNTGLLICRKSADPLRSNLVW